MSPLLHPGGQPLPEPLMVTHGRHPTKPKFSAVHPSPSLTSHAGHSLTQLFSSLATFLVFGNHPHRPSPLNPCTPGESVLAIALPRTSPPSRASTLALRRTLPATDCCRCCRRRGAPCSCQPASRASQPAAFTSFALPWQFTSASSRDRRGEGRGAAALWRGIRLNSFRALRRRANKAGDGLRLARIVFPGLRCRG